MNTSVEDASNEEDDEILIETDLKEHSLVVIDGHDTSLDTIEVEHSVIQEDTPSKAEKNNMESTREAEKNNMESKTKLSIGEYEEQSIRPANSKGSKIGEVWEARMKMIKEASEARDLKKPPRQSVEFLRNSKSSLITTQYFDLVLLQTNDLSFLDASKYP